MKNKENNELAVCGWAAVKALASGHGENILRLYFTKERSRELGDICCALAARKRPYNMVQDEIELEKLSGTPHHQGAVAMIKMPRITPLDTSITARWAENAESAVILDRVGNANNLGAIIRSAAFFGIKNIVIPTDEAQSSITTSSYRVAQGGMEKVSVYSVRSIPKLLRDMKNRMVSIGTSLDAKKSVSAISALKGEKGALIVLGNEENGMSLEVKEACDHLVIIPFFGMSDGKEAPVESLNVAQAASIIFYECEKK